MKYFKIYVIVIFSIVLSFVYMLWQYKKDLEIIILSQRASYLTTTQQLVRVASKQLEQLILDAEHDGICLVVMSGYRTFEQQQKLYDSFVDKSIVAKPGTSEHETGFAVDFGGCPTNDLGIRDDTKERLTLKNQFDTLPEYQWLRQYAHKYGFEQSYTSQNIESTGFPEEAWHWKFIY